MSPSVQDVTTKSPPKGISALAVEILIQLFLAIPKASPILRCRAVCRTWCQTIDASSALRYHIRLLAWGYEDLLSRASGEVSKLAQLSLETTSVTKLAKLETHIGNWLDLRWSLTSSISVPVECTHDSAGGIYVSLARHDSRSFTVIELPSKAKGIKNPRVMYRRVLDFAVKNFIIDPEQDLIVFVEMSVYDSYLPSLSHLGLALL